ncbi:DUF2778 domain-containing protein [Burkholderia pseudomallei]|uniref:DUF2778 domain-containing protein n=1 Tax=Burkholderia pseudomallei TaxID=28450 RepID=UPI0002D6C7A6|nr:DUF2778 domain-containing protein [Burkholderia pseudomallei]KGW46475.1 hypothetical protein Y049_5569 [Burkholderia pseudomallei MSHR684]AGR69525.1 hypothetical protein BDL_4363 [Burkholderia pseudomallei MSHR305]AHK68323.1 hypothetical protein BBX_6206 [Burkholderia pseudomallei MSHR520]AIP83294.1 hypothetical protein JE55_5521 [Burkholderia pseudomallei]AIV80437.1 hypothetical protein X978_4779 [Burkholderia pseudomallei MSHR3965]
MPAQCFYTLNNQRLSTFTCAGFGGVPAFSGESSFINKPDATAIAKAGPIPKGRYYIVTRESGGHLGWLYDFIKDQWSNSNRSTWFGLYRNDGVIDDWTFVNGVKRGNFRLHPTGRWGESEGCITVTTQLQFDRLRKFLLKQSTQLIPGTSIKYYGTVDVR